MTTLRFVLEVEVERETGKFASRDEISEKLTEAIASIEDADLGALGSDGDSVYTITSWTAEEIDNKQLKEEWKHNEHRVREALPGDADLRKRVRALTYEVREKVNEIRRLQGAMEKMEEVRAGEPTSISYGSGRKGRIFIPDGEFDDVRYSTGDSWDQELVLTKVKDGFEIRSNDFGQQMVAVPMSGNLMRVIVVEGLR